MLKKIIGIHENLPYWKAYLSVFSILPPCLAQPIVPLAVEPLLKNKLEL
jgi:hypothetical protein